MRPVIIPRVRWESIWYPDSAFGQILSAALAPLGWVYAASWAVYLGAYRLGLKKPVRLPIPIFCVGNLEVGGSGKTPLAIALADLLQQMGLQPAISVSGYGSPASAGATLFPPNEPLQADRHGDEPALIRKKRPALPLVIGRDRVAAAKLALESGAGAVVLDDGFQHLPLARTADLLVWQPDRRNRRCLPAGPLREPESFAQRAQALLVEMDGAAPTFDLPVFRYRRVLGELIDLATGERVDAADVAQPVVALSAIARPERFHQALASVGLDVAATLALPDHSRFDRLDLPAGATVVCTEKDAVKLTSQTHNARILELVSDVEFLAPDQVRRFLLEWIRGTAQ
jgi:tetraacyldisaccharide 4'-kinase